MTQGDQAMNLPVRLSFQPRQSVELAFGWLESVVAALFVANPDSFVDVGEEYLAVADLAGLRGAEDCLDDFIDGFIAQHNLQFDLGEKVDAVFATTIELRMAFLPAMAASFHYCKPLDANFQERCLHGVKLGGLNHRFKFRHVLVSSGTAGRSLRRQRLLFQRISF